MLNFIFFTQIIRELLSTDDGLKEKLRITAKENVGNTRFMIVVEIFREKLPFVISALFVTLSTLVSLFAFGFSYLLQQAAYSIASVTGISIAFYFITTSIIIHDSLGNNKSWLTAFISSIFSFLDHVFELAFPTAIVNVIWGYIIMTSTEFFQQTEYYTFMTGLILLIISLTSLYLTSRKSYRRTKEIRKLEEEKEVDELANLIERRFWYR